MSTQAQPSDRPRLGRSAFVLQDWSVNSSLYARLLLVSFRIGSLRATVAGRLTRLLLGPIYRVTELLFGRIGDQVVIGAGAKVIGDVTIGDDAVVGTNAVVVEDVPACATAVGVPARVIERDSPLAVNPATGF